MRESERETVVLVGDCHGTTTVERFVIKGP